MTSYSLTGFANYSTKVSNSIFEEASQLNNTYDGSSAIGSNEYFTKKMAQNIDYIKTREDGALVLIGSAAITDYVKDGTKVSFAIEAIEDSIVELPLTYYKGYREINNFNIVETESGLVGIEIPTGSYSVSIRYANTIIQFASYGISIVTAFIFVIYIIKFKKKNPIA